MAKKLYVKLQTPSIELPLMVRDASGVESTLKVGFKRYDIKDIEAKTEEWNSLANMDEVITNEILYFLNAEVEVDEDGIISSYIVKDTRTEKKNEGLWDDSKGCLELLIKKYMNSLPWKEGLFDLFHKTLINKDTREAELGN